MIWVTGSYLQTDPFNLLSYVGSDGWCAPETEGIGVHCFGDFNQFLEPGKDGIAFSPISAPAFLVLNALLAQVSSRAVLIAFLGVQFAMVSVPLVVMARNSSRRELIPDLFVYTLLTLPALTLLDRGNILAWALPGLAAMAVGFLGGNRRLFCVGLVIAAVVKPQFLVLAVVPLIRRDYRTAALASSMAAIATIATFLVFDAPFERFRYWISALAGYSAGPTQPDWRNYSWPNLFEKAARLSGLEPTSSWIHERLTLVGVGLLLSGLLIAFVRRHRIADLDLFVAASLLATYWVGTVYAYYLMVLLPPAWLLLGYPERLQPKVRQSLVGSEPFAIAMVAVVLAPIVLPAYPHASDTLVNAMPSVSSLLLLLLTAYLLVGPIGATRRGVRGQHDYSDLLPASRPATSSSAT